MLIIPSTRKVVGVELSVEYTIYTEGNANYTTGGVFKP